MSVYAVARVRQFMDLAVDTRLQDLIRHDDDIRRVESWWEDGASREQYRKELVFMALRDLVHDQHLIDLSGNISNPVWEGLLQNVARLRAEGALPDIAVPPSSSALELSYTYASIFLLEQYAYGDFVRPRPGDVFLDCGACVGDTAIWALNQGCSRVYSFEPSPQNSPFLLANTARCRGRDGARITHVPFGLAARAGCAGMNGSGGSTFLTEASDGSPSVPVIALDDWCRENAVKPDFIKMDIEGSEVDAIQGAAQVIASNRPQLAISLYHRLSDMWTIPAMLKAIVPDYKFRCRKNSIRVEFVLYASV